MLAGIGNKRSSVKCIRLESVDSKYFSMKDFLLRALTFIVDVTLSLLLLCSECGEVLYCVCLGHL